ncbi:unnamed protein product, partial [Cylicostephanus goldi]
AVSALHQLASHPSVAAQLCDDPTFIALIVEFLSRNDVSGAEDELLERELLGLLYQLSKTPEGARTVEEAGWQRDGLEPELFGEMYPVHGMERIDHFPTPPNNSSWFDTDL